MSKPKDKPHDRFFAEIFSYMPVARGFISEVLPDNVKPKLNLGELKLLPTSFVTPKLEKRIADLVFSCPKTGSEGNVAVCLIKEHKSSQPRYPHFQLLDYIREKWRQDRKEKRKPAPVICIVLHHGKRKWHYKSMAHYIEGMDDDLTAFSPLFDFVLVDLNKYPDGFLLSLDTLFLANALLVLKHSGEEDYIKNNMEAILVNYEKITAHESGISILRAIFVYIRKTTTFTSKNLEKMIETVPIQTKEFISGWDREIAEAQAQGIEKGIEKGIERGLNQKEVTIIRNGWAKGLTPELIAEIGEIPLERVKKEMAKLKKAAKKNGTKNGHLPKPNKK